MTVRARELRVGTAPAVGSARCVAVVAGAFAHPTVADGASDIPAVDLVGELLDQVGNALEMRMDRERAAVDVERLLVVAELLQDDAEPRQRAEMARLAREHLADVGERARVLLPRVEDGGAAVPGLDEIRPDVDDGVKEPDREVEVLGVGRGLGAPHQQVGGVAGGGEPDRPDAVLDEFGAFVVGGDLERGKQALEARRAVAVLDLGQRARRLDRPGRVGVDGLGPRRQGREEGQCRRRSQGGRPDRESPYHARKPNPRPRPNKDKISSGFRKPPTAAGAQPWRALNLRWTLLIT